jgi:hypothetical protein
MGSSIGSLNDKTNGYVRSLTMIGLPNEEFLPSSYIALDLMDRFGAYAGVVGLLRKGSERGATRGTDLNLDPHGLRFLLEFDYSGDASGIAWIPPMKWHPWVFQIPTRGSVNGHAVNHQSN